MLTQLEYGLLRWRKSDRLRWLSRSREGFDLDEEVFAATLKLYDDGLFSCPTDYLLSSSELAGFSSAAGPPVGSGPAWQHQLGPLV